MSLINLEYVDVINGLEQKRTLEFSKDLITSTYKLESLFVIKVDGCSMQPLINDKNLVVADLSQTALKNDEIYLVYKDNKMWIKQVKILNERICFVSINKEYAHLIFESNEVRVVAKALLTFTSLAT